MPKKGNRLHSATDLNPLQTSRMTGGLCNPTSETDKIYIAKVLSNMVEKGMLIRLSRNLYHIVPTSADADNFIPDWHLVAKYLMKGRDYYIGYYSAMQIHGLITQPSLKEIIVTNLQVKPSSRNIRGIEFQFVTHTETIKNSIFT